MNLLLFAQHNLLYTARMMKKLGLISCALVLPLVGCASDESGRAVEAPEPTVPATQTLFGRVKVESDFRKNSEIKNPKVGGDCYSPDGYSDIATGTSVTVRNAEGTTVAMGKIRSTGLQVKSPEETSLFLAHCEFIFSIGDVPTGEKFYSIEVGNRGQVDFMEEEMFGSEGVALTLGDVP